MSDETTSTADLAVSNTSAVPATISDNELAVLAGELVSRARTEGTALTGDGGLLTGLSSACCRPGWTRR